MPQRCWLAIALCFTPTVAPLLAQSVAQGSPSSAPQASLNAPAGTQASSLDASIRSLITAPAVSNAHWGIIVTALDGTPVFALNEAQFFRPASTAKLFTTAAALAVLGPAKRFTTSIYGQLNPVTGVVRGDLVIKGGGDPSFGTNDDTTSESSPLSNSDLDDLAQQLQEKGVRHVSGKVVADDSLFTTDGPPPGWAAEDLVWGYGALPSALSFGDNEILLTARAGTHAEAPAALQLSQLVPYLRLNNDVSTQLSGHEESLDVVPVPASPTRFDVRGELMAGSPPVTEHIALPDPSLYAALAFRALLHQRHITITGTTQTLHSDPPSLSGFLSGMQRPAVPQVPDSCASSPGPTQLLAQHQSAPLAADVRFTLKTSANLHAEILARQLAANTLCSDVTSLDAARALRNWIISAGLPADEAILYDGSGLSTKDLVTPRAEAQLLAYAAKQSWFADWKAALPIAGADGTLASRFTASPLKGNLFAKTGTLGETRALAGYLQAASDRTFILVIMVDNHEPGSSADRTTMDTIAERIAEAN